MAIPRDNGPELTSRHFLACLQQSLRTRFGKSYTRAPRQQPQLPMARIVAQHRTPYLHL
jgi:hypothetical protein